jgi:undecaprenyl diphosphate synthase
VNQPPVPWPRHVAIIMDGNGRWARQRRRPRIEGHRAGVKSARDAMEACRGLGIPYLTLYTFSIENWQRPKAEVDELMRLLYGYLAREAAKLHRNRIRLLAIGRLGLLPPKVAGKVSELMAATAGYDTLTLCLALSYGGRSEIVDAVNGALRELPDGAPLDAGAIASHLYAPEIPPPDLLIRTSGEMRLSNFLLWQAAHARLQFEPAYWPDFREAQLRAAIAEARARRGAEAGGGDA